MFTDERIAIKFCENEADILLSHTPGFDVKRDYEIFGSTKLLQGCQRPLQSHYIEHFKGHFVLMEQVWTETALSAVWVRTTNTAVRKQAQEIKLQFNNNKRPFLVLNFLEAVLDLSEALWTQKSSCHLPWHPIQVCDLTECLLCFYGI